MILAGMRPLEYADKLRDERARRAAEAEKLAANDGPVDDQSDDRAHDRAGGRAGDQPRLAVDIAPRPPSD